MTLLVSFDHERFNRDVRIASNAYHQPYKAIKAAGMAADTYRRIRAGVGVVRCASNILTLCEVFDLKFTDYVVHNGAKR